MRHLQLPTLIFQTERVREDGRSRSKLNTQEREETAGKLAKPGGGAVYRRLGATEYRQLFGGSRAAAGPDTAGEHTPRHTRLHSRIGLESENWAKSANVAVVVWAGVGNGEAGGEAGG